MHEILLPKMGNSVEDAEIVKWFKSEGDTVQEGDPLFSIQTDKAEVECECTAGGVLRKILVPAGVEVPVLTVVALVGAADEALPEGVGFGPSMSAGATNNGNHYGQYGEAPADARGAGNGQGNASS